MTVGSSSGMSRPDSPASAAGSPRLPAGTVVSKIRRVLRRVRMPRISPPTSWPVSPSYQRAWKTQLLQHLIAAVNRLDFELSPAQTLKRLRLHQWTWRNDGFYLPLFAMACFNLTFVPWPVILKLLLCAAYALVLLIPLTSQFFVPATPIFSWLLLLFTCRFIPVYLRPHIWVSVLPTLESVLYGANISDILTRYTNTALDVLAWFPYGVMHFVTPFLTAATLFVFGPVGSVQLFGKVFGFMNVAGVLIQIFFPCSAPWYELIYGLTPADYSMPGSPGGLARIDALFGSQTYTATFTASPMVFGAFPSLHSACATLQAFFLSHFFPRGRPAYWLYTFWMWWCTMYLTHHYLIDLVAGGFLATLFFHTMLTEEMRHLPGSRASYLPLGFSSPHTASELKLHELNGGDPAAYELASEDSEDDEEERRSSMAASSRRRSFAAAGVQDIEAYGSGGISRPRTPGILASEAAGGVSRPRTPRLPKLSIDDDRGVA